MLYVPVYMLFSAGVTEKFAQQIAVLPFVSVEGLQPPIPFTPPIAASKELMFTVPGLLSIIFIKSLLPFIEVPFIIVL